jgi:hypothetical protein
MTVKGLLVNGSIGRSRKGQVLRSTRGIVAKEANRSRTGPQTPFLRLGQNSVTLLDNPLNASHVCAERHI